MTDSDDPTTERARRIASSVREHWDDRDPLADSQSRRGFLGKSVLAGGTLLALGSTGLAAGDEHQDEHGGGGENGAAFDDTPKTDVDVLNYALTLEHLEDAFYQEGLDMFDESDFVQADALDAYSEQTRSQVYQYVTTAGEHESVHVDVLSQAVTLLGGEPAMAGSYDFGVESIEDFIALGATFENTGVAAYAGAAPFIESPDLLGSALAIHSVEARHAAVLNTLNGDPPFPNAFDPAATQQEVLNAVSDFIVDSQPDGDDSSDGES